MNNNLNMTKNEKVKLYTKNRVYMYWAIQLVYKKNVKIIVTTPPPHLVSEKKSPPSLVQTFAPLPNYLTLAPVLNRTARSAKITAFLLHLLKICLN